MASNLIIGLPKYMLARGISAFHQPMALSGTWHVSHSSHPHWKGKHSLNITYEILPSDSSGVTKIDHVVTYQAIGSDKIKTLRGLNTPTPGNQDAWDWRGKGWLTIVSSHCECLGFGHVQGNNRWIVRYFAKTLFTPAGIDIYTQHKEGLPQSTIDEILKSLKELGIK